MKCKYCGKPYDIDDKYCHFCGRSFSNQNISKSNLQYYEEKNEKPEVAETKDKKFFSKIKSSLMKNLKQKKDDTLTILNKNEDYNDTNDNTNFIIEFYENNDSEEEFEILKRFKRDFNVDKPHKFYGGNKSKTSNDDECANILDIGNNTKSIFRVRIEGIGNKFYDNFIIRPKQVKEVTLKNGSYSIQSFIEGSNVKHLREIVDNEISYYGRSPIDKNTNSNIRIVTFEGGQYSLWIK